MMNLFKRIHNKKHFFNVPYYQKNDVIIMDELSRETRNVGYIPEDLMNSDHVDMGYYSDNRIQYIPDRLKTPDMMLYFVSMRPHMFEFIPDSMLTTDFIIKLVSENPEIIHRFPDDQKEYVRRLIASKSD